MMEFVFLPQMVFIRLDLAFMPQSHMTVKGNYG